MDSLLPAAGHRHQSAPAYEHDRPEETVLYRVVREEIEAFLARERPPVRFGRDRRRGRRRDQREEERACRERCRDSATSSPIRLLLSDA